MHIGMHSFASGSVATMGGSIGGHGGRMPSTTPFLYRVVHATSFAGGLRLVLAAIGSDNWQRTRQIAQSSRGDADTLIRKEIEILVSHSKPGIYIYTTSTWRSPDEFFRNAAALHGQVTSEHEQDSADRRLSPYRGMAAPYY